MTGQLDHCSQLAHPATTFKMNINPSKNFIHILGGQWFGQSLVSTPFPAHAPSLVQALYLVISPLSPHFDTQSPQPPHDPQ